EESQRAQTPFVGRHIGIGIGWGCDSGLSFRPGRSARSVEAVAWNVQEVTESLGGWGLSRGGLDELGQRKYRIVLATVLRTEEPKGFSVLPRRWVVECTLAWLGQSRRLSKDYEELPTTSEPFIYGAMTRLMLRRLAA